MIAVVGLGFVGTSISALLSKNHKVLGIDSDPKKVEVLGSGKATVPDKGIEDHLRNYDLNLSTEVVESVDWKKITNLIICTPTNFDTETGQFDTKSVFKTVELSTKENKNITIFIKSTVPIGYTDWLRKYFQHQEIYFSPEFLREGRALEDNLYPSRIVVGGKTSNAQNFAFLLRDAALKKDCPVIFTDNKAAESIKLFSNTYLAMRVAYFNEIDTFCLKKGIDPEIVIKGVGLDSRIGSGYNNPSFGYGGYCLPKDTKQALSEFQGIQQSIIEAIVESNERRKQAIVSHILEQNFNSVGIYRLLMKSGSDNFRSAAIWGIIDLLKAHEKEIYIYEPFLKENIDGAIVVNNIEELDKFTEIILCNRLDNALKPFRKKVFTRDIFNEN